LTNDISMKLNYIEQDVSRLHNVADGSYPNMPRRSTLSEPSIAFPLPGSCPLRPSPRPPHGSRVIPRSPAYRKAPHLTLPDGPRTGQDHRQLLPSLSRCRRSSGCDRMLGMRSSLRPLTPGRTRNRTRPGCYRSVWQPRRKRHSHLTLRHHLHRHLVAPSRYRSGLPHQVHLLRLKTKELNWGPADRHKLRDRSPRRILQRTTRLRGRTRKISWRRQRGQA
jgi:hypothetical protein